MKYRDEYCGLITEEWFDKPITLSGWVDRTREVGGVTFVLLRDHTGVVQLVFSSHLLQKAHELHNEDVIQIHGTVSSRNPKEVNPAMKTGMLEVHVDAATILNCCQHSPFEVRKSMEVDENLRMKYRYFDLRHPKMYSNMQLRHTLLQTSRNYFSDHHFMEVETPYLGKSTPEGARDFLVPSRMNPGKFYALTQSPQLYKEMLMVGGIDRYFQICRCFRDEDFRLDRQPEFTQIDLEMAFSDEEQLYTILEGLMKQIVKNCLHRDIQTPFSKMTYTEAYQKYGTDKPDLRFDVPIVIFQNEFKNPDYKTFYTAYEEEKSIAAIRIEKKYMDLSRKESDAFLKEIENPQVSFYYVKHKLDGIGLNFLTESDKERIAEKLQTVEGDAILFALGTEKDVCESLGRARNVVGKSILKAEPERKNQLCFAWIHQFPLFLWNDEENRLDSAQHPFTLPNMEQFNQYIDTHPLRIESCSSDLVLNGFELGSGGSRIVDPDLQRRIFEIIGVPSDQIEEQFDYLLHALASGAPPEAGFALGVDRIAMILTESSSLRDVIAFPKNTKGASPLTKEPSPISEEQWNEITRRS
ncbi:MAG: aspartate--tRNA ligase [Caldisericia bacterium]|nr:aspartate--tRNA ligase [Caldisericia bacterium]MDD4614166.1 aspartate--tRNA ligase [Caldisericia bacterium]